MDNKYDIGVPPIQDYNVKIDGNFDLPSSSSQYGYNSSGLGTGLFDRGLDLDKPRNAQDIVDGIGASSYTFNTNASIGVDTTSLSGSGATGALFKGVSSTESKNMFLNAFNASTRLGLGTNAFDNSNTSFFANNRAVAADDFEDVGKLYTQFLSADESIDKIYKTIRSVDYTEWAFDIYDKATNVRKHYNSFGEFVEGKTDLNTYRSFLGSELNGEVKGGILGKIKESLISVINPLYKDFHSPFMIPQFQPEHFFAKVFAAPANASVNWYNETHMKVWEGVRESMEDPYRRIYNRVANDASLSKEDKRMVFEYEATRIKSEFSKVEMPARYKKKLSEFLDMQNRSYASRLSGSFNPKPK